MPTMKCAVKFPILTNRVLLLGSILLACAAYADAAPGKAEKTKRQKSPQIETPSATVSAPAGDCSRCHKAVLGRKFTHGPVGVGMCSVCHAKEQAGAKHHTFVLAKEGPELCLSCHETLRKKALASKVPHAAISTGGCTSCHDPHGSQDRFFLKDVVMDNVCANCHNAKTKGAFLHPPAGKSCALCHDPHGSENANLLKAPAPGLCLDCHQKAKSEFAGKHVHPPVKVGCVSCHDPHSAPHKFFFQTEVKGLCLKCHDKIAKQLKKDKLVHAAVGMVGCLGCHGPHTENQAKLLRKPMKDLCIGCHKGKAVELKSQFLHGPVAQNECDGCHDPHSSENPKMLTAYFPELFYNPYKDGLYALCFNCHEKDIARDAKTTTLTDFRNGDQNLHYVHVHGEKGRSCKACHQVHASNQEKHIRSGVPFGSWVLPIKFKKSAEGGTCNVGCHNPKSYSRTKAVLNP